jgi:hypothetical protein
MWAIDPSRLRQQPEYALTQHVPGVPSSFLKKKKREKEEAREQVDQGEAKVNNATRWSTDGPRGSDGPIPGERGR